MPRVSLPASRPLPWPPPLLSPAPNIPLLPGRRRLPGDLTACKVVGARSQSFACFHGIPTILDQDVEHDAVLIDRTLEIVQLAADFQEHLIEVRSVARLRLSSAELAGEVGAELEAPLPDALVSNPVLFMPTGGLPRTLRSNVRVSLLW